MSNRVRKYCNWLFLYLVALSVDETNIMEREKQATQAGMCRMNLEQEGMETKKERKSGESKTEHS